jgi:subtilisin family serine protease
MAGIIAAGARENGIQGIVPEHKLDEVVTASSVLAGSADDPEEKQSVLFIGAIDSLLGFLDEMHAKDPHAHIVVHMPLSYNWSTIGFRFGVDSNQDENVRGHVRVTSKTVQRIAQRLNERVLFVAAAGNDSSGLASPATAEYATPFGFASTHKEAGFAQSTNILVVEATERTGARADFSNVGGHVSAPGVDIMSTPSASETAYAVCDGTSSASAIVAGLAALIWDLDLSLKAADVARIIKESALPPRSPEGAPRVDPLAAYEHLQDFRLAKH